MKKNFLQVLSLFTITATILIGCGEKQAPPETQTKETAVETVVETQQSDTLQPESQEASSNESEPTESSQYSKRQYCEGIWEFDHVTSVTDLTEDELKNEGLDYNMTLYLYPNGRFDLNYDSRSSDKTGTISGNWEGGLEIKLIDDQGTNLGGDDGFAIFNADSIIIREDDYRLNIFFKFAGELPDEYYPEYPDDITGPWRLYKCSVGDDMIEGYQVLSGFSYLVQLDIREDGTFNRTTEADPITGTWKADGDSYIFDWGTGPLEGRLENNELIIGQGDKILYFNRSGEVPTK